MTFPSRLSMIEGSLLVGLFLQGISPEVLGTEPPLQAPSTSDSAVLKRILANWRARQQRIESFHFAWNARETLPPQKGVDFAETRKELWMEGDMRYCIENAPAQKYGGRFGEGWRHVFDGLTSRSLSLDVNSPRGTVWSGDDRRELDGISLSPLLLALRPFPDGKIDRNSQRFSVISENAIIDNKHYVKIQRVDKQSRSAGIAEDFWVDPARDDVIVHWERRIRERPWAFVSLEYQADKDVGWIPARWTKKYYWTGWDCKSDNTMTKFSINETFPRDTFALAYPPGTIVLDKKLNEKYLVAKNGSKVDVLKFDSLGALEIHEALETSTDFTIDPEPLKDALDFIAARYQIQVVIDPQAVRQGLIDPSIVVKGAAPGIKLRSNLNLLLEQSRKPLGFEIRKGTLVIIPVARPK
jgi:hypothetical protein